MVKNRKLNSDSGFTIIEVLIVLAIAGLILLIVFLAVPALQRNARNQSRKTDASAIAAAFSEFSDNNSGSFPDQYTYSNGSVTLTNSVLGANSVPSQAKVGYYIKGNTGTAAAGGTGVGQIYITTGAKTINGGANADAVVVDTTADCPTTYTGQGGGSPSALSVGGSARQFAVFYSIENGSGTYSLQCLSS